MSKQQRRRRYREDRETAPRNKRKWSPAMLMEAILYSGSSMTRKKCMREYNCRGCGRMFDAVPAPDPVPDEFAIPYISREGSLTRQFPKATVKGAVSTRWVIDIRNFTVGRVAPVVLEPKELEASWWNVSTSGTYRSGMGFMPRQVGGGSSSWR